MTREEPNEITMEDIKAAKDRIERYVYETPLYPSFSEKDVFFKLECFQPTGSFKIRGAANRILTLTRKKRDSGIVAASSGNHGIAVAYMANKLGIEATIVVPETVVPEKLQMIKALGANVVFFGTQEDERAIKAREVQQDEDKTLIGSFNDKQIIAGQGTCGLEITRTMQEDTAAMFVPIGGGGLISGILSATKLCNKTRHIKVIGVQPEGAPSMYNSWKTGKIVKLKTTNTIADGTSIRVPGNITFSIVKKLVDDIVLVSEKEILDATTQILRNEQILAEPSGAEAFAGLQKYKKKHDIGKSVAIISGGNISRKILKLVLKNKL